ncbi:head-tail adaptor protein [Carnobacterium sp. 1290_CSPC]|uniref:head-tail adaptor protein n=1 Tax=Carnobacterium sp. 1290_CSPC TaxID=1579347 RepID=UPI0006612510|nr:head-tail adaptor protein [Carnobacterium sp. 1290_CSPC]
MQQTFTIQQFSQFDDGIGGYTEEWAKFKTVKGYLDLVTGTDINAVQNAIIEQSTHIVIIPSFTTGITDKMRVVDADNRWYSITYADDPVGQHHHNELYVKFGGVLNG